MNADTRRFCQKQ